jgi:WxcM-like, C-terminal
VIHGVGDCRTVEFQKVTDPRGNLTFVDGLRDVPFEIRRVYWIYGVPGGEQRGGHAYRRLEEMLIAVSGSFEVHLDDGSRRRSCTLSRGYRGLYVPSMVWRQLESFSTNAICLVLASLPYDEADYIRDYPDFTRLQEADR